MRALSNKGTMLLGDIQPELREDPSVQQGMDALGREIQRVEDAIGAFFYRVFPSRADDTYRTLGIYEWLLGLPVEPVGVTLADRQANVIANIRKRHAGSGAEWVAALSAVLGNTWSHIETVNHVTIHIPYVAGGYNSGQVLALARRITPAHIEIGVGYNEGFLVGISLIGLDAL